MYTDFREKTLEGINHLGAKRNLCQCALDYLAEDTVNGWFFLKY
jgi:hypothetical protein